MQYRSAASDHIRAARKFEFCSRLVVVEAEDSEEDEEELGGLFRVNRPQSGKRFKANAVDSSRFNPDASHNWDLEEVESPLYDHNSTHTVFSFKMLSCDLSHCLCQMLDSIRDCFVTGKWEDDQDAATRLKEDGKRRTTGLYTHDFSAFEHLLYVLY